jgi:chitin disaccharide deacetylase
MKRLIVNADDFGRSKAINDGIIEGHQKGIVTSASLMTDRDAFDHAVQLAKANPKLGIGLHLDLDSFFEVQHGVGRLLRYKDPAVPMSAIVKETERQIEKALATGLPIRHLDGHHHSHLRPELFGAIAALTAKHKIPVIRYFKGFFEGLYPEAAMDWVPDLVRRFGLRSTDAFFAGWEAVESSLPGYSYFDLAVPFETAELMVHPGKGEAWRERELSHCTSTEVRDRLAKHNVALATFGDLAASA